MVVKSKKERVIEAVMNTRLHMKISEFAGKFYADLRCFNTMAELDDYIDRTENLMIFVSIAEELGLDYGYDGKKLTIQIR